MKTLIKFALVLVIGILIYNYYNGNLAERRQSEQIFQEVKELGIAVKDLLKDEHQKFKGGKYDQVLDNLKEAYAKIENKARELTPEMREKLDKLQDKRVDLQHRLDEEGSNAGENEALKKELEQLLDETDDLIKNMGEK